MTLYELVNDIEVQGAVRISTWENDEERILMETERTDDLGPGDLDEAWEDMEVSYIFCVDNVLHIEVSA